MTKQYVDVRKYSHRGGKKYTDKILKFLNSKRPKPIEFKDLKRPDLTDCIVRITGTSLHGLGVRIIETSRGSILLRRNFVKENV
jgi:hypothetical protein